MGKEQDLLDAARNGNITIVGKILDQIKRAGPLSSLRRSPSINSQDVNGYTPLHHACLNGHSSVVRLLLAHDAIPDMPDIRGSNPLYLASWAGHQDIVKMLLTHNKKPANPNVQTIENETPLHCAAQHGHNTVLAILLAYGANPTIRNNSFQTALDLAAQFGRLHAVQILIRTHPELIEPLSYFNYTINTNYLDQIVKGPGNKLIFTHTCLHLASRNGHKKVVESLLAAGVDVNILTNAGTALHEAALCGKKSVVNILLHAGIDPNATDGNGRTALDILRDYPPHVTYEIATAIKDFCMHNMSEAYFKPIAPASDNDSMDESYLKTNDLIANTINESHDSDYEISNTDVAVIVTPQLKPKPMPRSNPSLNNTKNVEQTKSNIQLENMKSKTTESYLQMKPIKWQESSDDKVVFAECTPSYRPVYKPACIASLSDKVFANGSAGDSFRKAIFTPQSYENVHLTQTDYSLNTSNSSSRSCEPEPFQCRADYVTMTVISPSASFTPISSPRIFDTGDYANIDSITKSNDKVFNAVKRSSSIETNNIEHSPTPEFPPPSVAQAECAILEIIKPLSEKNKRTSFQVDPIDNFEDLETFVLHNVSLNGSCESNSSRSSDCVEEFVGDAPFAGLFKGSSLNLNNGSKFDYSPLRRETSCLRSPTLVRSIQMPQSEEKIPLSVAANTAYNFNETKIWDEINSILEFIGNEVSNVENSEQNDCAQNADEANVIGVQESLKIRNPSDLCLGISSSLATEWYHSPNTLLNGHILFNVYYLGSTVIRELHGTTSTRKSIQKLKIDETLVEDHDANLLQDCSSTTKYLKANKQTRLPIKIAVSHIGVRFLDIENEQTICSHEIQNINCVCQDAEDFRYFAYITKENDLHYCHVFMVDELELAKEIIMTLGQAFEIAYQLTFTRDPLVVEKQNDNTPIATKIKK